jgi:hypothetical protein
MSCEQSEPNERQGVSVAICADCESVLIKTT